MGSVDDGDPIADDGPFYFESEPNSFPLRSPSGGAAAREVRLLCPFRDEARRHPLRIASAASCDAKKSSKPRDASVVRLLWTRTGRGGFQSLRDAVQFLRESRAVTRRFV